MPVKDDLALYHVRCAQCLDALDLCIGGTISVEAGACLPIKLLCRNRRTALQSWLLLRHCTSGDGWQLSRANMR